MMNKVRKKIKTLPWDPVEYLKTDERMAGYLEAALEDGARAKGMTKIAKKAGLGRESLYKALSRDGNPELVTVLKVVRALGLKLKVAA
jgi:probable addiction module antidote protein